MRRLLFLALLTPLALCRHLEGRMPARLDFKPLEFTPPKIEVRTLTNGTTLYLLADHELPLVQMTAYVRTGTAYEPPGKNGTASFCGTLMRGGGTRSLSADAMDEELEFLGASVETGMDTELGSASLNVLKKDLDRGLSIFADVLMHPAFDGRKLSVEKAKAIESIRRRNDEPFAIARREFRKMIYGPDHPLSRTLEIPAVKKISRKSLAEFHAKYYHPNNTMIAVSGDFEIEEMAQKIEAAFAGWKPAPVEFPPLPRAEIFEPTAAPRAVGYAERPLHQSSLILGHFGVKRHNPDRFALEVMNEVLGGSSFTSRLYKEVRSKEGLAYWVGSSFSEPWDRGTIAAGCQTKNQTVGRAVRLILEETEKMRQEAVPPEELEAAKDAIINSFVFRYGSSHAIVTQKMSLDYFGYPPGYLESYTKKIAAVTSDDVLAAARKYLHPERMRLIVVGNGGEFDRPLSDFGSVKTLDLSIPE